MPFPNKPVTGHCWQNETIVKMTKNAQLILPILGALVMLPFLFIMIFKRVWQYNIEIIAAVSALLVLNWSIDILWYDRLAAYELTDPSAKILSKKCRKMRRAFSWSEVTAVQEARIDYANNRGSASAGIVRYYVLSRGAGNLLATGSEPETYASLMGHHDRLSFPKTPETEAFVMEKQRQYGFTIITG